MRSYSTPQSALNLEFTKLAIIECIASVALYVGIALYFGTFRYVAAAVVVAPLMLFRTEASTDWALKVYQRYWDTMDRADRSPGWWFIGAPIVATGVRIIATLYWAARNPLKTLNEMPGNWLRQCFCTDFFHPPEMLPLEAARGDRTKILTFAELWESVREDLRVPRDLVVLSLSLVVLVIGYLPAFDLPCHIQSHCSRLRSICLGSSHDPAESVVSEAAP
jgi:hypothetical protein